jgi:hypothetical protein
MTAISPLVHLILQIVITMIAVPLVVWFIQRGYSKADKEKKEKDDERHNHFKESMDNLVKKVTDYCQKNHNDHEQLFEFKNDHAERITTIETTHKQRGCDQPYHRRRSVS